MSRSFIFAASLLLLGTTHAAIAQDGKALYETTCVACHGPRAEGAIPGVPDLVKGGHLAESDEQLVADIIQGTQSKGSPLAMPPKGGNPTLTTADVQAIVTYMKTFAGVSAAPAKAAEMSDDLPPGTAAADVPPGDPSPVPAPKLDMTVFARGAKAWADNCARCHDMINPKDHSDGQWKVVSTHMRVRAGLGAQQTRDITLFLQRSN